MWDGLPGRITVAKYRIKLLQLYKAQLHGVPSRAVFETRSFEKAETDESTRENIIEPALVKWATPLLFVFKKDKTLQFCYDFCKDNTVSK